MQKSCSNCQAPAEYSIVAVVSTVGVVGRLQKANGVNTAYTALADRLRTWLASGNDINRWPATS